MLWSGHCGPATGRPAFASQFCDLSTLGILRIRPLSAVSYSLNLALLGRAGLLSRGFLSNGIPRGLVWLSSAYFCQTKLLA